MDKPVTSKEIYEQYIDAATALIMDRYASIMQKSIAEETPEQDVAVPEALDKRCRKLIRKGLAKERRRQLVKKSLRFTRNIAVVLVLLVGIGGILFSKVDAIRIPVTNFILEQKKGHLEYNAPGEEPALTAAANFQKMNLRLQELLPEDYVQVKNDIGKTGDSTVIYQNPMREDVIFATYTLQGSMAFNTEGASTRKTKVGSYEAILIQKNSTLLVWLDSKARVLYQLLASDMTGEELLNLAEELNQCCQ